MEMEMQTRKDLSAVYFPVATASGTPNDTRSALSVFFVPEGRGSSRELAFFWASKSPINQSLCPRLKLGLPEPYGMFHRFGALPVLQAGRYVWPSKNL